MLIQEHDPIWLVFFVFNMFNLFRIFENEPNATILNLGCSDVCACGFLFLFFIFYIILFPLSITMFASIFS